MADQDEQDVELLEGEELLTPDEIGDIMNIDPFSKDALKADEDEDGAEDEEDSSDDSTETEEDDSSEDDADGGLETKPAESDKEPEKDEKTEPDPRDLEMQGLKQQLATLQDALKAVTEGKKEPAEDTEKKGGEDLLKLYNFTVPSKLMDALNSEDPAEREQGVSSLLQGMGVAVHQQVMQHVDKLVNDKLAQISVNQDARTKQQEVFEDFYSKFPALKPFQALVQQTGVQMARESGMTEWNDQFRDALGVRVMRMLEEQAVSLGYTKPEPEQKGKGKGKKPPKQLSSSSRPGGANSKDTEPNSAADIAHSLGLA